MRPPEHRDRDPHQGQHLLRRRCLVLTTMLLTAAVLILASTGCQQESPSAYRSPFVGRPLATGAYISSAPVVRDLNGDGSPEILAASDALHVWDSKGHPLPGWPQRAKGLIASTPAVSDLDGDGLPEVVVGSDDNNIYAWHADGRPVAGWPVATGNDVFSSPAVSDLDGDGRPEVVVGSDDGGIYVLDGAGRIRPGWPVWTGGFVSASPTIADLDQDGHADIIIGSWDGKLYALGADGTSLPGWPVLTGAPIWSKALVVDLAPTIPGSEVLVASDQIYAWTREGKSIPGWPQRLRTYTVSSPVAAELDGKQGIEIVIGGDALWAFRADGTLVPGWPHATGSYVWATPLVVDLTGDGKDEVVAGDFGGRFHLVGPDGRKVYPGWPVQFKERIVSSAALLEAQSGDGPLLVVGGWDKKVHLVQLEPTSGDSIPEAGLAALPHDPPLRVISWSLLPKGRLPVRVIAAELSVAPVQSFTLTYYDRLGNAHPSPFLLNGTRYEALIAPLRLRSVKVALEVVGWDGSYFRLPPEGTMMLTCPGGC